MSNYKTILIQGSVLLLISMVVNLNKGIAKENEIKLIADVMDDDRKDTIVVCQNAFRDRNKNIYVIKNGARNKICEVQLQDETEIFYLEANDVSTLQKGLRLKIRNRDLRPEYAFADIIHYNKKWVITQFGRICTYKSAGLESCVYPAAQNIEYYSSKDDDGNPTVLAIGNLCARMDPEKWVCE